MQHPAGDRPAGNTRGTRSAVLARNGAIATSQPLATAAGLRVLQSGGNAIDAAVTFIAPQAEFTPPVIYSKESRAKLVFLVEAKPTEADAPKLHPGQPVDVTLQ